jgi:hypothetical protein
MKTAKEWAEEIRNALSHGLRYDPVLVSGETVIEEMVAKIQEEAHTQGRSDSPAYQVYGAHETTGGI